MAATVRANRERILAAVELGLSNSTLEGLNSKIRLINHRSDGPHSAAALISMIYLCCGGLTVAVPSKWPTPTRGESLFLNDPPKNRFVGD